MEQLTSLRQIMHLIQVRRRGKGMEHAPFGIVGLETAFPLLYTHFVEKGIFTLKQLIDWLTIAPAKAFQLTSGKLEVGAAADITVINLEQKEEINHLEFKSKGKNTPFSGWNCKGWPIATFVDGKLKWNAGGAQ